MVRKSNQYSNMLNRIVTAFVFLAAFSCGAPAGNEQSRQVATYDEAYLKSFVHQLPSMGDSVAGKRLDSLLRSAAGDSIVFRQTVYFLHQPLSSPNSAYRNDDLFEQLLQWQLSSKWFSVEEQELARGRLHLVRQNRPGKPANNFTFITPAGKKQQLYDIPAKYLLLYFNNPECDACKEMRKSLVASAVIRRKLESGELKLLSVYTDTTVSKWKAHLKDYPAAWIHGRDEQEFLHKNKVYDLRAIPTLYLLDSGKRVVLKDVLEVAVIEGKVGF